MKEWRNVPDNGTFEKIDFNIEETLWFSIYFIWKKIVNKFVKSIFLSLHFHVKFIFPIFILLSMQFWFVRYERTLPSVLYLWTMIFRPVVIFY